MAKKSTDPVYIKHQHKVMIILGLVIVLFTFRESSHWGVIFGSLITGVGIARVRD